MTIKPTAAISKLPDLEGRLRAARLGSGLVMMAFVTMHIGNLALSLISLDAAEAARWWFELIWRNPAGTIALYGSMLVHVALVLRTLYRKRTLVMPAKEALHILAGLVFPLLIAEHVVGTRVFGSLSGINIDYAFVVRALWVDAPLVGFKQVLALLAVWIHGCLGLHFWLRFRPWYRNAAPYLLIGAVLVPVLGLLGFADAGKVVQALPRPPLPPGVEPARVSAALAAKDAVLNGVYIVTFVVIAGLFAARGLRQYGQRRNLILVRYESGQSVRVPVGTSVLEASRMGGIPHYAVCGGRGRCSTCRIRVTEGAEALPPPGPLERITLGRIGANPDVRLACQIRPAHPVTVMPLLAADRVRALPAGARIATPGREQEIAVLFCDIRSFTALADRRLPFDVVFLLNRYFAVVGKAVEQSGGQLDKFIGDGAMALFGLHTTREEACRQALEAASVILSELGHLDQELASEISAPLRVAIGIHAGPAIVGAMGYGGVMNVTAIGDTVNIASRLESVAKQFDAALVVSDTVVSLSGVDLSRFDVRTVDIRGSAKPLSVRVVPQDSPFVVARPGKTIAA